MELTAYFHRIYGIVPWNQQQKSMAFHELPQFFVVGLFAINCHGNLKNAVRILRRF